MFNISNTPSYLQTNNSASLANASIIVQAPSQYPSKVVNKTADWAPSGAISAAEYGINYTNIGASGTIIATLPTAVAGWRDRFTVGAAQILRVVAPASTTISVGGLT